LIDDPDKTERLITDMKAALPLDARLSPGVRATLRQRSLEGTIPDRCQVISIFYMGEEGGIVCGLDIGGPDTKTPFLVSITHLAFDRRSPLFRPIDAYQRHRIKKLKQQAGRGY
jgi:hypothetical protein